MSIIFCSPYNSPTEGNMFPEEGCTGRTWGPWPGNPEGGTPAPALFPHTQLRWEPPLQAGRVVLPLGGFCTHGIDTPPLSSARGGPKFGECHHPDCYFFSLSLVLQNTFFIGVVSFTPLVPLNCAPRGVCVWEGCMCRITQRMIVQLFPQQGSAQVAFRL